ncbi:tail fiber domain-containing protein [Cronobacter sakazakii]|uniref:Tail fiber domain-containing protein n=1 Tax=Cronobacter sakazakii TaxID=28141 RepID=A0AAN6AY14_CROSK|nr:pyocin knob domain-containing S74 family peptidase [Cronobacter sakazakii]EGT5724335.1 tail fiber domain-containing protein [Cronobacter sakazakii]EJG0810260.1 tail fiber domain-containing protein [Cronobacter sakazakii]KAB0881157.1 tail fiber domain-containing protein [Cronobacter sakazakii]
MSAGTLTLTNKSAAVTGNGTSFTTELKAGDLIVVKVGGTPYTLPVKAITNNTQLMLVSDYTGPTQSGAAWFAVPQEAQSLITAALASQTAEALRGLNLDKTNWQQVFSASDDITVTLKDGSTFSGPSWLKIINFIKSIFSDNGEVTATTFKPTDIAATWENMQVARAPSVGLTGTISHEAYLSRAGIYLQPKNAEASVANGYPEVRAGSLLVLPNGANGSNGSTQLYFNYQDTGGLYFRRYLSEISTFESGGPNGWKQIFTNHGDIANSSGGSNATVTNWNDIKANHVAFGYTGAANNPGSTGTCLSFSNSKYPSYAIQFTGSYASASRYFARSQNGDGGGVWQPWREFTMAAVSDERLKDVKGSFNVEAGLDNINRMEFKLFRYKWDEPERSARRGVIAQQIMQIDKEYVKDVGENMVLDQTPMLLDALAAIKALRQRDEDNKARIVALETEQAGLKAAVARLIAAGSTNNEDPESEAVSGA